VFIPERKEGPATLNTEGTAATAMVAVMDFLMFQEQDSVFTTSPCLRSG